MQEFIQNIRILFNSTFENGGPWNWILVFALALLIATIVKAVFFGLVKKLSKITGRTKSDVDDIIVECLEATKGWVIFLWAFYLLIPLLHAHESVGHAGRTIIVIATGIQIVIWGLRAINHWRKDYLMRKVAEDTSSVAAIGLLCTALQGILLVTVALAGLSNLGVDVAALVAGLGVGGIAVALAAQNILGDLLASLSIVLDKPFVVGDFITVGNDLGTVENIGVKTTRIRSLSGEEVVFSNKDLLESRIHNYKRMWERRVVQKIGVTYSTPAEQLEKIPLWIKSFIDEEEMLRLDRCHFAGLGESSLDFEFVFFVKNPDFNVYMDVQQRVLLKIYRKFAEEGVEFAFPSQTVYVEKLPYLEYRPRELAAGSIDALKAGQNAAVDFNRT